MPLPIGVSSSTEFLTVLKSLRQNTHSPILRNQCMFRYTSLGGDTTIQLRTTDYAWMDGRTDGRTRTRTGLLSVSTPLHYAARRHSLTLSASLAFENWTGKNNNEAEKKGEKAERVKLACVTTIPRAAKVPHTPLTVSAEHP